jgi:dienelactone hydrolase
MDLTMEGRPPPMSTDPAGAALAVVDMARNGQFAELCERFAPPLRDMVSAGSLRAAWEAEVAPYGPVTEVRTPLTEAGGPGLTTARVPVTFERGELTIAIDLAGEQHWITGIQFLPAGAAEPTAPWEPPPYADPAAFTETDVTLGDPPLAVTGILSVPRGTTGQEKHLPAVLLLSGSGPHDPDETIGRNKPLKDLAWGLATAGIAVLRFEKVTHAHPVEVVADPGFTLTDEYVPQALAGLRLLREQPAIDPARLYLAGHSLGGSVAPRVAAAAAAGPAVAGMILLAGGAQPLHWSAVRQFRYLATVNPGGLATLQPAIDAITAQARAVDDPGLSAATPRETLPFGVPAPYWLDLRGYDPPAAAAALGKPMLIVQGGRDYQATVDDDLSRWQAALGSRPDVTIRVYDADNHLFFPGSGPSSPEEYEPAQHMDPEVIAGIASWLSAQ